MHIALHLAGKVPIARSRCAFPSLRLSVSHLHHLRSYVTMDRSKPPYESQDPRRVGQVLDGMHAHLKKGAGSFHCKTKTYKLGDASDRTIDSWQMSDWDYKKPDLPTYARGFFTHSNNGKPEIALRGYDKFFNVDEVKKTKWSNIEQNTRGPYELSVKENGCIIFVAGLDDETLVVTSKHSLGPRDDASANHALAGEKWIDRQLGALGRSRGDLAKTLRSMNATAVAELCDDEFEEHVLQYRPEAAGLYLHGINLNLPEFATFPGNLVETFADEWGFRKVTYIMENYVSKLKTFLEQVAETGHYEGRDTEGFVVRCQARDSPQSPWHHWFFKYKFEEPYLMYRQWRECTKDIIGGRLPKYRKHKKITEEYLDYARRRLIKDPDLGRLYNQNHGIIDMREGFLAEKGLRGSDIIRRELEEGDDIQAEDVTHNVVLVPIATLGCGKTTVALALSKLFGWGHEQNDNIQGKGQRPQRFAKACTTAMSAHPVIVSDRNNHQRREREQIINDIRNIVFDARLVALHWVHDPGNHAAIKEATRARVLARGDNHQTIQAGSKSQQEIVGIMDGFLQRFEPLDTSCSPDEKFDLVIDLDVTANSIDNLSTIVNALHKEYPKLLVMPTNEAMDAAINAALESYKPDIKHDLGPPAKKKAQNVPAKALQQPKAQQKATPKAPKIEYFSVCLSAPDVNRVLGAVFTDESHNSDTSKFWNSLRSNHRIQKEFHVTLIHRANSQAHADYWNTLTDLFQRRQVETQTALANSTNNGVSTNTAPIPDLDLGRASVHLLSVVFDGRVMAITVDLYNAKTVNAVAHITVGTANNTIKPMESNDMLAAWHGFQQYGGDAAGQTWKEIPVKGHVVLEGSVRGVLSR